MSSIVEVAADQFDNFISESEVPIVLDFTAVWCGPCKALLPALEDVASAFDGRAKVLKIDIDEAPQLRDRFAIRGVPTMVFMVDGQEQQRISGAQTRGKISSILESFIRGDL